MSKKDQLKAALENLLLQGQEYLSNYPEHELSKKTSPDRWSKKEILGHLIDSAINNLQRFTEIQFEQKPFAIHSYKQVELVKANNYQQADSRQMLDFWLAINRWIIHIMENQTEKTQGYKIELANGENSDLKFLMEDYVAHLAHHLNQIMDKNRN